MDDSNLPDNFNLSLVLETETQNAQYRLQLAKGYKPLVSTGIFNSLKASQVRTEAVSFNKFFPISTVYKNHVEITCFISVYCMHLSIKGEELIPTPKVGRQ